MARNEHHADPIEVDVYANSPLLPTYQASTASNCMLIYPHLCMVEMDKGFMHAEEEGRILYLFVKA